MISMQAAFETSPEIAAEQAKEEAEAGAVGAVAAGFLNVFSFLLQRRKQEIQAVFLFSTNVILKAS